jgi:hypothetical protein
MMIDISYYIPFETKFAPLHYEIRNPLFTQRSFIGLWPLSVTSLPAHSSQVTGSKLLAFGCPVSPAVHIPHQNFYIEPCFSLLFFSHLIEGNYGSKISPLLHNFPPLLQKHVWSIINISSLGVMCYLPLVILRR